MKKLKIVTLILMFAAPVVLVIIGFELGSGLCLFLAIVSFYVGCAMSVVVAVLMLKNKDSDAKGLAATLLALSLLKKRSRGDKNKKK